MEFVQNIIWNSVEGFVEAGTRTAGSYAGDVLIKAGDVIEGAGRGVGTKIERAATNYGTNLTGQTYQGAAKALPSTALRPVASRAKSLPPATKAIGPSSKTPIGANKYPGGKPMKQITNGVAKAQSTVGAGQKQITNGVSTAKSTVGAAQNRVTGAAAATKSTLPKAYPNNVPYGTSTTPAAVKAKKNTGALSATTTRGNTLPKAFPNAPSSTTGKANNTLPKPFPNSSAAVKTPVRPGGQPKPFAYENKAANGGAAPSNGQPPQTYPGTNTPVGQGSKTPVKKYKPLPRMDPVAEKGKVQHIPGFGAAGSAKGSNMPMGPSKSAGMPMGPTKSAALPMGAMKGAGDKLKGAGTPMDKLAAAPIGKVGGKVQHIPGMG